MGAGNPAGQAPLDFALYAASVTMLVRGDMLAGTMSDYLVREIEATPKHQRAAWHGLRRRRRPGRLAEIALHQLWTGAVERVATSIRP